jgi:hypothetical protein
MPSQDTDWHRTSFSTVAIVSITSSSVKVKAELLAFDYRQRAADIDLAENAFAALGIALPLRPACGDGSKGIRDNLFSMGHETSIGMFLFCSHFATASRGVFTPCKVPLHWSHQFRRQLFVRMRQMAVIDCFSTRVHPPQGETHAQTSDAYADRARRVCFGLHNNSAKFKSRRFSVSTAVFRESRLCTWLQTDKRVVVRLLTGLGQLRANEALKRPAA